MGPFKFDLLLSSRSGVDGGVGGGERIDNGIIAYILIITRLWVNLSLDKMHFSLTSDMRRRLLFLDGNIGAKTSCAVIVHRVHLSRRRSLWP